MIPQTGSNCFRLFFGRIEETINSRFTDLYVPKRDIIWVLIMYSSSIWWFGFFPQFSEDKKKRYEEIRKRVTNDLLSMPSESASQEVATPSTSGDAEKPKKSKEEIEAEEREKMQVLVSHFTEDQLDRYEMYRRAAFPKAAIKRIMQTITGCSVGHNVVCG